MPLHAGDQQQRYLVQAKGMIYEARMLWEDLVRVFEDFASGEFMHEKQVSSSSLRVERIQGILWHVAL